MSSSEKTVNLSNRLTPATAVKKRAGGLLAEKLRQKGWSITSAALYLGVSRQRLYSVWTSASLELCCRRHSALLSPDCRIIEIFAFATCKTKKHAIENRLQRI